MSLAALAPAPSRRFIRAAVLAALLLAGDPARADGGIGFQLLFGAPLNAPMPLEIRQSGEPDIDLTARFATRPFDLPLYLGMQLAWGADAHDWAIEYLHQKLYLSNPPPEVQSFSVSHGYNLFAFTRGFRLARGLWARAGAGPVLAHPESTVRGRTLRERGLLGTGYYLSGATLAATIEQRLPVARWFHVVFAGKLTAAYAVVPVDGGSASVPSVSLHALAGIGFGPAG